MWMGGFRAGATEGAMTRRRKTLVTLAIVLLLGALCGAVGWLACRDDPPPEDADLRVQREAIPDGENAFACFEAAGKAVAWPEDVDTWDALEKVLAGDAWDAALVEKTLEENRRALDLWEQGLARPRFQTPAATSIKTLTPYNAQWLTLAKVASLRSLNLAKAGRPEEAFEEAMRIAEFGHRIEGAKGVTVTWFVGATVKHLGLDRLRRLAAETPLPPERLRAYVDHLAPLGADTAGLADALRAEYAMFCGIVDDLGAGTITWSRDVQGPVLYLRVGSATSWTWQCAPRTTSNRTGSRRFPPRTTARSSSRYRRRMPRRHHALSVSTMTLTRAWPASGFLCARSPPTALETSSSRC